MSEQGAEKVSRRRDFIKSGIAVGMTMFVAGCEGSPLGGGSDDEDEEDEEDDTRSVDDPESIAVGETVNANLAEDDGEIPNRTGTIAEPIDLSIDSETELTIRMESSDFTPYVVVFDSNEIAVAYGSLQGEDTSEATGVFLEGEYTIWAASIQSGNYSGTAEDTGSTTGDYTLSVEEASVGGTPGESGPDTQPDDGTGPDTQPDDGTGPDTEPTGQEDLRTISVGQSRQGFINEGEGRDPQFDALAEPVSLTVRTDTDVRIVMRSDDFDPYVVVSDSTGNVVDDADDGAGGYDTELLTVLEAGQYTIWATTYDGTQFGDDVTGNYTLTVEQQ